MSKWKCEICDSEFENYHAQGFEHKIYCPLCYFKELNNRKNKEIERLNNIIKELEKYISQEWYCFDNESVEFEVSKNILDKLKELKEDNNEK